MRHQPDAGILSSEAHELEGSEADAVALLRILRKIRMSIQLKRLLAEIINSPERTRELVEHSYSHNNGFDKFVIDSVAEFGLKLRLHVWWTEALPSPVHDHPWDFASCLLLGQMIVTRFTEVNDGHGTYLRARYPTLANQSDRRVTVEGTCNLKALSETVMDTGSFYSLCHGELHSVAVRRRVTATMVLQGEHTARSTRVYVKAGDERAEPFDVRYFTIDEAMRKLERLRELLP